MILPVRGAANDVGIMSGIHYNGKPLTPGIPQIFNILGLFC